MPERNRFDAIPLSEVSLKKDNAPNDAPVASGISRGTPNRVQSSAFGKAPVNWTAPKPATATPTVAPPNAVPKPASVPVQTSETTRRRPPPPPPRRAAPPPVPAPVVATPAVPAAIPRTGAATPEESEATTRQSKGSKASKKGVEKTRVVSGGIIGFSHEVCLTHAGEPDVADDEWD